MDWRSDKYLETLEEMEGSWQMAVGKAMCVRETQLTTAHKIINSLREQLTRSESLLGQREAEILTLRQAVKDLETKLDSATGGSLQIEQRIIEEKDQALQQKDKEIEEMRQRHKDSVMEVSLCARSTLLEMEVQLEEAKAKITELEEIKDKNEKHLQDWNHVSERMCKELSEVKGKLQSTKYANSKLRGEISLRKKYCEKLEGERKKINREIELEERVLTNINLVTSFINSEEQQRYIVLEAINSFGNSLREDMNNMKCENTNHTVLMTQETQTEKNLEDEIEEKRKESIIELMEHKERQLEDDLRKAEVDIDNLEQQNMTLREVIKAMKKERENWQREKDKVEEEVRVTKLEESVRMLKNNLLNEKNDACLWSALKEVKKEVSNLKNKTVHKSVRKETETKNSNVQNMNAFLITKPLGKY